MKKVATGTSNIGGSNTRKTGKTGNFLGSLVVLFIRASERGLPLNGSLRPTGFSVLLSLVGRFFAQGKEN
jgi:hypothetical protein